jgi:glycosyltransferase involved in cell wall biosynthesis
MKLITDIKNIVNEIQPDIIHIWGTEKYWGLLSSRGYINGNILLEIQGLKFAISQYFYSGLTLIDIVASFRLNEFIKPGSSLPGLRNSFRRWGVFEKEMILYHKFIGTQSDWVRAYVRSVNPQARLFTSSIILRREFLEAPRWRLDNCIPFQIFSITSSFVSYKGFHVLLEAAAILKKQIPQVKLVLAGNIPDNLRANGYSKYLRGKVKSLGLESCVIWSGPLKADEILKQMQLANVVVIPSYIESYCLTLDEALTTGVPVVASFAGAMPELASSGVDVLFFPPGDAVVCAAEIRKIFLDYELAERLSLNSYEKKRTENYTDIASKQMDIYTECCRL